MPSVAGSVYSRSDRTSLAELFLKTNQRITVSEEKHSARNIENTNCSSKSVKEVMAGQQLLKRIPRIKFPVRHPDKDSLSATSVLTTETKKNVSKETFSELPSGPRNPNVGGKASIQPKRTPVSEKEIEAILLGGCF